MSNPLNLKPITNEELIIYKLVTDKYLITDYGNGRKQVKSNNCIDLDRDAKKMSDELVELRKTQGKQTHINFLMFANKLVLDRFNLYDCRNRIEDTRLDSAGIESTKFAIKAEKSVLGKSNSEVNTYLVIGGLVILSTLLIMLTNKK